MSTIPYWLAAMYLTDIGPVRVRRWLNHFDNIKSLFTASIDELKQAELTAKEIQAVQNPNWKLVEDCLTWCEKNNCQIIADEMFPTLLREIHDAPLVLFGMGDLAHLQKPQIAIVGTRNPTAIGRELAEQFAYTLAQAGIVVTSGLALGIDTASHEGCLAADAPTIAVLGSGLNKIYPTSNQQLAHRIRAEGLLLSEFAPGTPVFAYNFPRRNRIISGLSLGVLVIEAAIRSGSLITARFASEQGREVFAIPGSIHNPLVRGCHKLIQQGAKLIEKAEDILEELEALYTITKPKSRPKKTQYEGILTPKEINFLSLIDYARTPWDMIMLRSGLTGGEVSSMLLSLELRGYVRLVPGGYARCSSQ